MRGLEQAKYQAERSFKRRIAEKETLNPAVIAKVGNGAGTVIVPGRSGWIYVRLHGDDNQLTEAKLGIPLDTGSLNDAWVRVKKASPRKASYYVLQEFITSSTGDPAPPMSAHPLDPDDGPHVGTLTEDEVIFDDAAGHDHAGTGNAGKKVSHPDLLGVAADQHHPKIHAPAHKSGGEQPLDVTELVDSEGRLLTGVQKIDLTDGGLTILHQHAGGTLAKHIHAYKEDKSAECDGVKVTFITAQQFEPYTLRVFHERLEQVDGMVDYAEGAMYDHFDMVAAPDPGDKLIVHYLAQRV